MTDVVARALQPADAGAARALVVAQFSGTRYESRLLEQLAHARRGDDPECRAMVAIAPGDQHLHGLMLFGTVSGAQGVAKIHALVGEDRDAQRTLAGSVRDAGARMVICEVGDDAPWLVTVEVLRELGFAEEGRVADFFRDGVALRVLTWRSR